MRAPICLLTLTLALAFLGCARTTRNSTSEGLSPGGLLITAERIQKSGGHTAWDVLRREAPMLTFRENRNGQATAMGRRGQTSLLLSDAPVVILDGVRVPDFRSLQLIPAETIFSIYILTGIDGTTYYGTNAVSGVILIRTKDGS